MRFFFSVLFGFVSVFLDWVITGSGFEKKNLPMWGFAYRCPWKGIMWEWRERWEKIGLYEMPLPQKRFLTFDEKDWWDFFRSWNKCSTSRKMIWFFLRMPAKQLINQQTNTYLRPPRSIYAGLHLPSPFFQTSDFPQLPRWMGLASKKVKETGGFPKIEINQKIETGFWGDSGEGWFHRRKRRRGKGETKQETCGGMRFRWRLKCLTWLWQGDVALHGRTDRFNRQHQKRKEKKSREKKKVF